MSGTDTNWYSALVDNEEEEVGTLHTISDDDSSTNEELKRLLQQEADYAIEQKQLEREIDAIISDYNINSDEDILDFDEMTSTMPDIVSKVKEEFKAPHQGTLVRADVTIFKDHLSNALATINHPSHTGGCAHLLDDQKRYQERLGNDKISLPVCTKRQDLPDDNALATKWKRYEALKKIHDLECHCRDEVVKIIVVWYPGIMKLLETPMSSLPLELTVKEAFVHIMNNISDVLTTQEDYTNTLGVMLARTYSANGTETLGEYLNKIETDARRMEILGYTYPTNLLIAQCQTTIRNCGISKMELRKLDTEWDSIDQGKPEIGRYKRFKEYYIQKMTIMVADNVSGTKQQHQANSALEKQVSDLMSTVSQLQGDNKVLMTNQEEMASIYNGREEQSMVPNEIATSGGSSSSPGPDMMSYIGQLIKDGIASATD